MRVSTLRISLLTGLLVGTLDAIAAVVYFKLAGGGNPLAIARYIASGVFGSDAFSGGTAMVVWGFVFHYLIATIWSVLYFLLYPKISGRRSNKFVSGVLYGVLIWLVMNLIVVPLSATPPVALDAKDLIGMGILIVAVGLPIAYLSPSPSPERRGE